jgi:hypothetical protein
VTFVGDLKFGRTVHSLVELLTRFNDVRVVLASPASLRLPLPILESLVTRGLRIEETSDLSHAVERTDVLYVTRVQAERFEDPSEAARLVGAYVVDRELLKHAKADVTILHPLPSRRPGREDVTASRGGLLSPGAQWDPSAHGAVRADFRGRIGVRLTADAQVAGHEERHADGDEHVVGELFARLIVGAGDIGGREHVIDDIDGQGGVAAEEEAESSAEGGTKFEAFEIGVGLGRQEGTADAGNEMQVIVDGGLFEQIEFAIEGHVGEVEIAQEGGVGKALVGGGFSRMLLSWRRPPSPNEKMLVGE